MSITELKPGSMTSPIMPVGGGAMTPASVGMVIHGVQQVQIALAPGAMELRQNALVVAQSIKVVGSDPSEQVAVDALKTVNGLLKAMEQSRKLVKGPIDKVVATIQDQANGYTAPLEVEKARLAGLIEGYQQLKQDEVDRLERERQAEMEQAAEKMRQADQEAADAAKKLQDAKTPAQKKAAQAKIDEANAKLEENANALRSSAPVTMRKAKGSITKQVWDWEVTDMAALEAARPDLIKKEIKTAQTNMAAENAGVAGSSIPGLRIWKRVSVTTKS